MAKKNVEVPARKSLLEKVESTDKFKTVSARIPEIISDDFDKLVERAKLHGFTITATKVIVSALKDAVEFENIALDKLKQPEADNEKPATTETEQDILIDDITGLK